MQQVWVGCEELEKPSVRKSLLSGLISGSIDSVASVTVQD